MCNSSLEITMDHLGSGNNSLVLQRTLQGGRKLLAWSQGCGGADLNVRPGHPGFSQSTLFHRGLTQCSGTRPEIGATERGMEPE